MNKEEKVIAVEELKGQLADYKSIYLTDIAGLNAVQTSKLRRECFNSNVKLSVVKNTFLERAMSESENDFGELKELLKGNTTIMLSTIGNSPAKVIKKFRKDADKPILKGAFVDEAIYIGDEHIDALFNLKSKEEVIGEIITLLQSPAKNVISALKSSSGKIAGLVKTLSEKPAEEVKAEEPAAEEVKAEEPVAEEVKAEEPAAEEVKAEETNKAEEQTSEDESKDESE
ncbi:MAG: 50S ribosomal protein L10 [Cryomorphaceae bacterium MED-G11]|nr:MAG: 50S ribosomal protein L10 [Cryomorphaceae bacterium MED-G11]